MSVFQYLLLYVGIPLLISIIGLFVGLFCDTYGISSSSNATFDYWFWGLILGIVGLLIYLSVDGHKKLSEKTKDQIDVAKKIKLPICYSNKILRICFVLFFAYICYKELLPIILKMQNNLHIKMVCVFIVFIILVIMISKYDESKGSVLVASNTFKNKFNNVKEFSDKNYKFVEDSSPFLRSLRCLSGYDLFMLRPLKTFVTSLEFMYNDNPCVIGTTDIKLYERKISSNNTDNYSIQNIAFIELEHTVNLKCDISIGKHSLYVNNIIADKGIIPKYKNLGIIHCSDSEYAKKIITEHVQLYVAELGAYFRNFSILFSENKITLSIKNAKWSSWFSRTFMPQKNAENILKTTEIVLEYLKKISEEIEEIQKY